MLLLMFTFEECVYIIAYLLVWITANDFYYIHTHVVHVVWYTRASVRWGGMTFRVTRVRMIDKHSSHIPLQITHNIVFVVH